MIVIRFYFLMVISLLHMKATTAHAIHAEEAVFIGGIRQWIQISGKNDQAPVLLFLHGGPGNSSMGYGETFTRELQHSFLVVQWDQRDSGKTASLNASGRKLTVSLFVEDAISLIEYLARRFDEKKIYLAGHSWGGFLALRVATLRPDLLHTCIAISPMIHQVESEEETLAIVLQRVKEEANAEALQELEQVKVPFENGLHLFYHRKWVNVMMHTRVPKQEFVESWAAKWLPLYTEAAAVDLAAIAPEFHCPVFFFLGRKDYLTYFQITENYYRKLTAPEKNLLWFENSGHSPHLTEPRHFQQALLSVLTEQPN